MACEMALDGITHMMNEWSTNNGGVGTMLIVSSRAVLHEFIPFFYEHTIQTTMIERTLICNFQADSIDKNPWKVFSKYHKKVQQSWQ